MFGEVKMDRISPKLPPAENLTFNMQILRSATILPNYYKVSAFDQAENESRISLEEIQDTPMSSRY